MKKVHGMSGSRLYNIWTRMKQRCSNPKDLNYRWYGAKGITVCQEWRDSFEAFMHWALANGYNDTLTIDRENANDNYEPNNCRWITREANVSRARKGKSQNMTTAKLIEYNGKSQSLPDWAKELGISYVTLHKRLYTSGYTVEEAFTFEMYSKNPRKLLTFKGVTKSVSEWSKEIGIPYRNIHSRLHGGWTVERTLTTPVQKKNKKNK